MRRKFSTFAINVDFRSGWDMGLGEYIDTKKQREERLRAKRLVREKDLGRFKLRSDQV